MNESKKSLLHFCLKSHITFSFSPLNTKMHFGNLALLGHLHTRQGGNEKQTNCVMCSAEQKSLTTIDCFCLLK